METNVDKKLIEDEFHASKFYFSYSSLNRLLYAPQLFYRHYVLNQREDVLTPALLQGKVIHCMLLDNGSFEKQFILLPGTIPSDNPKIVVDRIYQEWKETKPEGVTLADYQQSILSILSEINLHQSLKTDVQRMEKLNTPQNNEYFDFLKRSEGRDVVDIETLDFCTKVVESLKQNSEICALLGLVEEPGIQVFNEMPLECDVEDMPMIGIKGILDNIKIDHEKKTIWINDVKTISKSVSDFEESVEFWNLWLQAAIYDTMVRKTFLTVDGVNPAEWEVIFTFVVVDKYLQVYPFEVSKATMVKWKAQFAEKLKEGEWHFNNRCYTLPYRFLVERVIL